MLEHSVKHFPDWVAQALFEHIDIKEGVDIADDRNYFYPSHQGGQAYEKLWEIHPDVAYDLVKRIIKEIISKRKFDRGGSIIVDSAYLLYDRKNIDLYKHYEQLDKLQEYLEKNYPKRPEFVKAEVQQFLASSYITEIIIAFTVIYKYPQTFEDEAYEFFIKKGRLDEVYGLNQYLKYMLLEVFGEMYHDLTTNQQKVIDENVISKFQKKSELSVDYKKTFNKSWYGIGKYELLSSIKSKGNLPKSWEKDYQELFRKFGKTENKEPEGIKTYVNRDPIEGKYDAFTFDNWKTSFKKYKHTNKNYDSWNYPAEYEHGRRFADVVTLDADEFVPYLKQIIEDKEISNTYVVKGLEGLKDGKVKPDVLKNLMLQAINERNFDYENKLYLIWLNRYFIEKKKVYPEILDFLKEALENGDEGRELGNDALNRGANSVRGAAASALVDYSFDEKSFDFICDTLTVLVDNSRPSTRAAAIHKMQYLLRHDKERILSLFLRLSNDFSPGILKVSIMPLQYLVHYRFDRLIPFFKEALKVKEANKEIGKLITLGYCNSYDGASDLLEDFLKVNEPNSVIKTALEFIEHSHQIEKALEIVTRFLDSDSKEIGEIYNRSFFHIKPKDFSAIRTFLFAYVDSNVGKWRDHPFYDFLLKCSSDHYNDCIKLASKYENHFGIDVSQRTLRNEPLKVIINAYNAVREYRKDSPMADMALDIFDGILKNEEYRDSSAYRILEDVDTY
ncbi:hypothetical protein [Nonlabens agnitus]|uniref:Uncharacterized protein n=1 Tax=Nonlabens agnitus TaxID=870484 RepID=A0A2S9WQY2_9FLAO|nr:hypothetical protein [Nonlabens agnitus]PRP65868.1 hypothetical protein BST86_01575 [Nonlabens agnitus]